MDIKKITTENAPLPKGHYTQAVIANGMIFISGQLPVVPVTGERITGTVREQMLRVLENIKAIAEAAGSDIENVVKVTIYVTDIELWGEVNAVYAEFFGAHKPARTIVPVKELHYGFKVEIDAIADVKG
jgi:2-iminobutanoate/2-iminopropanoate deaminase